jgi:hypothetical protein
MPPKTILLRLAAGQPKKNEGKEGRAVGSHSVMLPTARGRRGAKKVRRPEAYDAPAIYHTVRRSFCGLEATTGLVPVEL